MASARILKTKYAGKNYQEYGGVERLLSGRVKTARRKEGIVTWGNDGGLTFDSTKKADEDEIKDENFERSAIKRAPDDAEDEEGESKAQDSMIGQEWFGRFSDSWGDEDEEFYLIKKIDEQDSQNSSLENTFLRTVKNLSLHVDGVDRNLLNDLFPIASITESNSTAVPMREIQETGVSTNPNENAVAHSRLELSNNNPFQSNLTTTSTKSQEELLILRKRFISLLKRKDRVNLDLDSIQARYKLLQLAEDRVSNLEPVKISEEKETNKKAKKGGSKSKKEKEKESGNANEKEKGEVKFTYGPPCGYDSRLNWDEERFMEWSQSHMGAAMLDESQELDGILKDDWEDVILEEEDQDQDADRDEEQTVGNEVGRTKAYVCNTAKRKCKKHTDWSMVRGADFEVEKEVQVSLDFRCMFPRSFSACAQALPITRSDRFAVIFSAHLLFTQLQTNLLSQLSLDLSSLRDRIHTLTELINEEEKSGITAKEQKRAREEEELKRANDKADEDLARAMENEGRRRRG